MNYIYNLCKYYIINMNLKKKNDSLLVLYVVKYHELKYKSVEKNTCIKIRISYQNCMYYKKYET